MSPQNLWKEKGTGQLKLNVRREDGEGARLGMCITLLPVVRPLKSILHTVMRKEAVYTVLLNAPLFKGMRCTLAQDPRYLRFSVLENGVTTHYNFRVRLGLPFSDHPLYGLLTSVCGCRCQTRGSQKNSLRRSTHIFQANEVI